MDNLTCNGGKQIMSVSPSGDVKPCVIFPVTCGNINPSGIKAIWQAQDGLLGDLRKIELSDLDSCPECQYKSYCVRCHAAACLETGDMLKPPSSSCRVAKLRYQQSCEKERNNEVS
jgi:radical SAM protein with 4Fe4S-binding SPASM domain